MKNCPSCNQDMEDLANHCPHCGQAVSPVMANAASDNATNPIIQPTNQPMAPNPAVSQMKTSNVVVIVVVVIIFFVIMMGILSSIVIVSLTGSRDRAKKASLQTTMASLLPVMSMCQKKGEKIQPVVAGGLICSGKEITETYPQPLLPVNLGVGWNYELNASGDVLVGTGPGDVKVTCNIAQGTCQ